MPGGVQTVVRVLTPKPTNMTINILLVNPPIYDFAAYDFWLKPYGLLTIAGYLRGKAQIKLFDYLDRSHPLMTQRRQTQSDRWGRGKFACERIDTPACLSHVPRYFRRFGLSRRVFQQFLRRQPHIDFVLVQTTMTYWYPGVREVIEDTRRFAPNAKVVLGGNYVTLCPAHAGTLGADLCVPGVGLEPLWSFLGVKPDLNQPAMWELYGHPAVGVLKLSDGCPFACTYCSVPMVYGSFKPRPLQRSLAELELLVQLGATNIAFYDDALLYDAAGVLKPFLQHVIKQGLRVNFHSPNGLNARLLDGELAALMVRAGFRTFCIGFESISAQWHKQTGSKAFIDELSGAVDNLLAAGAEPTNITAYQMLGHPRTDLQKLAETMRFVNRLGIRGMLADFSPIPGTPDGELCRKWVDLDEPLMHNKTAFAIALLGFERVNRIKDLQRRLNRRLGNC